MLTIGGEKARSASAPPGGEWQMMARSYTVCAATINGEREELDMIDYESLVMDAKPVKGNGIRFIGRGKELGEHHHDQIVFVLWKPQQCYGGVAMKRLARLLGDSGAHVEVARSNLETNIKYCQKEGDYDEWGEKPAQGARGDLKLLVEQVFEGATTVDEIVIQQPQMHYQYGRTLEAAEDIRLKQVSRDGFMPECFWVDGPSGSGKSHFAMADQEDMYIVPLFDNGWWDNYTGQNRVVFNDFRASSSFPFSFLLQLMDVWPVSVRRRGKAPMPFVSKEIYFTCVEGAEVIFYNEFDNSDLWAQWERRVQCIHMEARLVVE